MFVCVCECNNQKKDVKRSSWDIIQTTIQRDRYVLAGNNVDRKESRKKPVPGEKNEFC